MENKIKTIGDVFEAFYEERKQYSAALSPLTHKEIITKYSLALKELVNGELPKEYKDTITYDNGQTVHYPESKGWNDCLKQVKEKVNSL